MSARIEKKTLQFKLLCLVLMVLLASAAQAELYILSKITSGTGGCEGEFTMEILPEGTDYVTVTFTNNCTTDGVITALYMNENDLLLNPQIIDQAEGVSFSPVEHNAMMPGGHDLGFTPQTTFSVKADPAGPKNGLHGIIEEGQLTGDYITLLFELNTNFDDLINSINQQELGLGIHAQALPGGVSGSFVAVPEPATIALLGLGTLLIHRKRRGTAQ